MLGDVEPFFAKIALFDVTKKHRISENFYFDMNSKKIRDLLGNHLEPIDPPTKSLNPIFSLSQKRNSDIWLVLMVEKVKNKVFK